MEREEREVIDAAREVMEAGKLTKEGKPKVKEIEKILGRDITEADRDVIYQHLREQDESRKVEVKLVAEHTHRGVVYVAGSKISVWPDQEKWLKGLGVIE